MLEEQAANLVGQWVPTILIVGLYTKLVKLKGATRKHRRPRRAAGGDGAPPRRPYYLL